MILFLYGDDTFRSRRYLEQSIEKFKRERDPQGYNVIRLDGKKTEVSKLLAEMAAAPFLSPKRMVIVENIASSSDKETVARIIEKVEKQAFPESSIIVFWQGEAVGKTKEAKKIFELLSKEKYAQLFDVLTGDQLDRWFKKTAEDKKIVLTDAALRYLLVNTGHDLWQADSVLEQVAAYTQQGKADVNEVALFVSEKVDDNIFSMVEAIVRGDRKRGLELLNEQRLRGQEDMQLFGMLVWQFRVLLQIADVIGRDPYQMPDMIAKEIDIHPFVVKKNLPLVKRFSATELRRIYGILCSIDAKTKTGQADQALLLDLFVVQMK